MRASPPCLGWGAGERHGALASESATRQGGTTRSPLPHNASVISLYRATIARAFPSQVRSRMARNWALLDSAALRSAFSSTAAIAWLKDLESRGDTSRPVSPFFTTSGMPPTAVATTGVPHIIASGRIVGKPSITLEMHRQSAAEYQNGSSS